jgi:hypothetical protein
MNDNQIIDSVLEEKQDSTTSVSETVAPEITNDNDYLEIKYNKEQIRIDKERKSSRKSKTRSKGQLYI